MRKLFSLTMVLLIVAGLVLSACQAAAAAPRLPRLKPRPQPASASPRSPRSARAKVKVGLVTDVGKVNDKSFNQSAWEGVQQAQKDLGAEVKYIETPTPRTTPRTSPVRRCRLRRDRDRGLCAWAMRPRRRRSSIPNIKFIGVDQFQAETVR